MATRVTDSTDALKVVVIGTGQMGRSHLLAYHHHPGYQVIGLVTKDPPNFRPELRHYEDMILPDVDSALTLHPDVVSINTYPDTHADYAIAAMTAGAHVFVEKPLATTVERARQVVETAKKTNRKLVVGYILRHHPSWTQFISHARDLGPPFVMRMNINQRSSGDAWETHKRIMKTTSPLVDCGVHYVDVMLQITNSRPVQVRGIGARVSNEIDEKQVNYAHLQLVFEDGSVGWYESGWGPMVSETGNFIRDVFSPNGSVSIVDNATQGKSADIGSHMKTANILLHKVGTEPETLSMDGEPDHDALCALEQEYLYRAIREDRDLTQEMDHAVSSLQIVIAADTSMKENRAIDL